MDEPQPIANAAAIAGSAGFVVSRNDNDFDIRIDAPSKERVITVAWLVSGLILAPSYFLFCTVIWTWVSAGDDFACCAMTFAPLLAILCFWQTLASLRRIGRAHRLGARTTIGVASGVLWCATASEPTARYTWPVVDIWRLQANAGRFSRNVLLQIRSRRRPLVQLRIPCKQAVAAETMTNILRHAIASAVPQPQVAASAVPPGSAGKVPSESAAPPPSDYAIQYSSGAPVDWVVVGIYAGFAEWQDARAALSKIEVLSRLDSGLPDRGSHYTLAVPSSQEPVARDWLARPQEWRDHSACPQCGTTGEVFPFWTRVVRCVKHPTRPFALGGDWRFCPECGMPYIARD